MTKEEAKHFSEVLKAYSEDKELEYLTMDGEWVPKRTPNFDANPFNYRIKPDLKYRPYNSAEEFLKALKEHGPYLTITNVKSALKEYVMPVTINDNEFYYLYHEDWPVKYLKYFEIVNCLINDCKITWQDDTPCGILEE